MQAVRTMIFAAAGVTISTSAAAQLSMSSRRFAPPTADEQAVFDRASTDVFPSDVRRDPAAHADTLVFWTGVTDGSADGVPFVEHHYFDGAVEGNGSVWLSPWGEGRFCLLDVPPDPRTFASTRPRFVRAYGTPVVTDDGVCLRNATYFAGDRGYTTTIIEYGPNGQTGFSRADAEQRGATRSYPEDRLRTRFGFRALVSVHGGKASGETGASGWSASLELDLRLTRRAELAFLAGPHAYPGFGAPTSIQVALLFRYYVVGIGAAFGPLLHVPLEDDGDVWIGGRYMPMIGDALGAWGLSPAIGGGLDVTATTDGDVRALLQLSVGVDGNLGKPPSRR